MSNLQNGTWADEQITDSEYVTAIEWLANARIIVVDTERSAYEDGYGDGFDAGMANAATYDMPYPDVGNFRVTYHEERYGYEWDPGRFMANIIDEEIKLFNMMFKIPHDVAIITKDCDEANAYYSSYHKEITLCYELIDHMMRLWTLHSDQYYSDEALTKEHLDAFVRHVTLAILYHELGHALVDTYDLPVTGIEEDAVDQFAIWMLLDWAESNHMMQNFAFFWKYSSDDDYGHHVPFWDTHSLNEQRFYNVLCWAYGFDPEANSWIADNKWLPEDRAGRCYLESSKIDLSWQVLLDPYLQEAYYEYENDEHVHAGMLVKIFQDAFDFSFPSYQMQVMWIHFEGGNGYTVHRHASDVTLGYMFESMGIVLTDECYVFPEGREFCTDGTYELKFYINRERVPGITDYVVQEDDRILISFGNENETEIQKQLDELESIILDR